MIVGFHYPLLHTASYFSNGFSLYAPCKCRPVRAPHCSWSLETHMHNVEMAFVYAIFLVLLVQEGFYLAPNTAKRGGCFDQCVWLPQLHYMTITCLGM